MGFSTSSSLVVGVSMSKLFKEFKESSETFDEFDKYGKKTGKQFNEYKLTAVLYNNSEVVISTKKKSDYWLYDWYNSIEFDGNEYSGNHLNVTIEIHMAHYENNDLDQMIMGINVCNSDSSNYGDGEFVSKVDENKTNDAIAACRKQLAELFGYTGEINLYLFNNLSY